VIPGLTATKEAAMKNDPTTPPASPEPPPALDSFREDGWTIQGSPAQWVATRIRGPQSRVIAANSAPELLERLIAAAGEEEDPRPC
jgi:hypothetical protein